GVENSEDDQGEETLQRVPLPRAADEPGGLAVAREEVQIDEELDVRVVRASLEEALGNDEDVLAAQPLAEQVTRGLRDAAHLDTDAPVRAEEDRGVQDAGDPAPGIIEQVRL